MPAIVPDRQIPLAAVRDAATHVYAAAVRTPLIQVEGHDLYLKLEVLQPIGSFKIRGAYNVVRQLTPEQLEDGVWTVSAGNAAQGVAFAARKAGVRCSVMVMDTAPGNKDHGNRAARRIDRPRYLRRVLANRRIAWLRSHDRTFRPPVR